MKTEFSFHAIIRMAQRGLEEKDIRRVIAKGQKQFRPNDGFWHAKMNGIEVVYEKETDKTRVITCYWD